MAITASEVRKNLFPLIEQVNSDRTPVEITSKRGDAVLIGIDDYRALEETAYLLRTRLRRDYSWPMAFDEGLAERIRMMTAEEPGLSARKMFGGLCFMHEGNMCFGIVGNELMVRVGPDSYTECLALPHAREMDFTGRSMKGMVYVAEAGFGEDDDLGSWLHRGLRYAASLPAKLR